MKKTAPEEFHGVCIGQLNQRRVMITNTAVDAGYVVIEAEIPLKDMFGYSGDLRGMTQGKGEFTMEFIKYAPVPRSIQEEIIEEYKKSKK